jgi:voltage-gated potassium channel
LTDKNIKPDTKNSLRRKAYLILEDSNHKTFISNFINSCLILLIFVNVTATIFESEPGLHEKYFFYFLTLEISSLALFMVEYIVRLWCCVEVHNPKRLSNAHLRMNYFRSPIAIIDLIAILPSLMALFFSIDLRVLRLFRVLRLLKLTHYFKGFNIFITVLGKELKSMFAALMLMLFLIIIAASLMHTFEGDIQPEEFGSILSSFWWAVVTMTTVGYGDVIPATVSGKVIATFIMLTGVALVALPAGMLAARFTEEIRERKKEIDNQVMDMLDKGKIKNQHYHTLEKIADELDIETEDLIRTISYLKENRNKITCNHCGKKMNL